MRFPLSAIRFFVGHSLADRTPNRLSSALSIDDIKCGALVVPKVEFGKIPLQMLRTDVVVCAGDTALEHCEIAFDGVCVWAAPRTYSPAP